MHCDLDVSLTARALGIIHTAHRAVVLATYLASCDVVKPCGQIELVLGTSYILVK